MISIKKYLPLAFLALAAASCTPMNGAASFRGGLSLKARLQKKIQKINAQPKTLEILQNLAPVDQAPTARRIASALIIQQKLIDLIPMTIKYEAEVLRIWSEQQDFFKNSNKKIIIPGICVKEDDFRSPEAISLRLRYNRLQKTSANEILSVYPGLINELTKDLPNYLASTNDEVKTCARELQNKIDLAYAKDSLKKCHSNIKDVLNDNQSFLDTCKAIQPMQYTFAIIQHMESYQNILGTLSKRNFDLWIEKLANLIEHHRSQKQTIDDYYTSIIAFLRDTKNERLQTFLSTEHRLPKTLNEDLTAYKAITLTPLPTKKSTSSEWMPPTPAKQAQPRSKKKKSSKTHGIKPSSLICSSSSIEQIDDPIKSSTVINDKTACMSCDSSDNIDIPDQTITTSSSSSTENTIQLEIPTDIKSDGSFIKQSSASMITLEDPKHNAVIKLFKLDKPTAPTTEAFARSKNLSLWFENPDKALDILGYNDREHKNYNDPSAHDYLKKIHTFALAVDDIAHLCGIGQEVPDRIHPTKKNVMILIPGSYMFQDGTHRIEKTGLFTYIIDPIKKKIFHRMFHVYQAKKLIDEYNEKGIWQINIDAKEPI